MFTKIKEFKYQSYKQLRNECEKNDHYFNDPMFGADHLCIDINGTMQSRELQWLRPKDIYPDPRLGFGPPLKGKFSTPAVAAALTALSTRSRVRENVVDKDQDWVTGKPHLYKGIFHFCFHFFGEWTDVVIDDRLPCQKHKLVYMSGNSPNEFWPALVEKAYAKLHGSYNILNNIPVTDIISDLTGGVCELVKLADFQTDTGVAANEWERLFQILEESYNENTLFIATNSSSSRHGESFDRSDLQPANSENEPVYSDLNIAQDSLYVISDVKKINIGGIFNREYAMLIRMISPTQDVFNGPFSPSSMEWANLSDTVKKEVKLKSNREFWMTIADFQTEFSHLIMNHSLNTSFLSKGRTWCKEQFRSWWSESRAGGFSKDPAIHIRCNHQYFINVPDEDTILIFELTQKPQYVGAISSDNPFDNGQAPAFKKIGISVLRIENNREHRIHRTHYERSQTSEFEANRSVCLRTTLPEGRYCVIPSTLDANETGEFVLRIFSSKSVGAKHVIEDQPVRHWLVKCFLKPYLAGAGITIKSLKPMEGVVPDPDALDNLAKEDLSVVVECEKTTFSTLFKKGCTWEEEGAFYIIYPATSVLHVRLYKKQVIGSTLVGSGSLPLAQMIGTLRNIDEVREKDFILDLFDKKNMSCSVSLSFEASFFSELIDM